MREVFGKNRLTNPMSAFLGVIALLMLSACGGGGDPTGPGAVIEPQHARTLHAQELGDPTTLREAMTPRSATRRPEAALRR